MLEWQCNLRLVVDFSLKLHTIQQTFSSCCIKLSSAIHSININTLCLKENDIDVSHYNFEADQPDFNSFWQRCCLESMLSNGDLLSHLSYLVSLHYLGKHERQKLCLISHSV